jgi:CBS-domain-containing membrane protein
VGDAVRAMQAARLPAIPVVDDVGTFVGIFGEREFIAAIFPGYLELLRYAGFVRSSLDSEIERRSGCWDEPVGRYTNREHVEIREGHSAAQLAETFLHHRVLIAPVLDVNRHVTGIVTRAAFFAALVERVDPLT